LFAMFMYMVAVAMVVSVAMIMRVAMALTTAQWIQQTDGA